MNPVLESIEPVILNSKHVQIDKDKVRELSDLLRDYKPQHWTKSLPFDLDNSHKLGFLFVFNAISFCYWGEPKWTTGYERGTWCMIASLQRAIDEGMPIYDQSYLSKIKQKDLAYILRGNTQIPLLEERLRILNELGSSEDFKTIARESNALELVDKIIKAFPSFEDSAIYNGNKVTFNKRAQLLVSDISNLYRKLRNTDQLTACADYILPMVLRYKGILRYSEQLAAKVDNKIIISAGSEEEVEIRANTLQAVEVIKEQTDLTSTQINDYLWVEGDNVPQNEKYHLTRIKAY